MTVRFNAPRSVHQHRVDSFMEKAGQDTPDKPCVPSTEVRRLRASLMLEECLETIRAMGVEVLIRDSQQTVSHLDGTFEDAFEFRENGEPNIVEVVDGCCDTHVVTTGTLTAFALPMTGCNVQSTIRILLSSDQEATDATTVNG